MNVEWLPSIARFMDGENIFHLRTTAALVVTLMFLMPGPGAKAQSLGDMKQYCEQLESYWRLDPPGMGRASIPNQAGAAICYGYILAFSSAAMLVGIMGDDLSSCYQTPEGKMAGGRIAVLRWASVFHAAASSSARN
jgi:hypothetical protein